MRTIKVSDGLILVPETKVQVFVLWHLSFFIKGYGKTFNPAAYPENRRFKINYD